MDDKGEKVQCYLVISGNLYAHWAMLDEVEDGYVRVEVACTTEDGQTLTAWIYQLLPQNS